MTEVNTADIEQTIRDHILQEFLPGESPDQLTPTTPLMTSGILDSIRMLKLVTFIEDTFSVNIEAHEADAEHMDSVALIAALIREKS